MSGTLIHLWLLSGYYTRHICPQTSTRNSRQKKIINALWALLIGWNARFSGPSPQLLLIVGVVLRGTIVNRTYGTDKNLYVEAFLPTIFSPVNYGPPALAETTKKQNYGVNDVMAVLRSRVTQSREALRSSLPRHISQQCMAVRIPHGPCMAFRSDAGTL